MIEPQEAVPEAAVTLVDLLGAVDERTQIRAAETVLDRAGITKAKQVTAMNAEQSVGGDGSDNGLF